MSANESKLPLTDLRTIIASALLLHDTGEPWSEAVEVGEENGWLSAADAVIEVLKSAQYPEDTAVEALSDAEIIERCNLFVSHEEDGRHVLTFGVPLWGRVLRILTSQSNREPSEAEKTIAAIRVEVASWEKHDNTFRERITAILDRREYTEAFALLNAIDAHNEAVATVQASGRVTDSTEWQTAVENVARYLVATEEVSIRESWDSLTQQDREEMLAAAYALMIGQK